MKLEPKASDRDEFDRVDVFVYDKGMNEVANRESTTLERVRDRIKHELEYRRLTHRELAEGSGLSRPWLTNFLLGKVALSFADADAIADFLGISFEDLVSEKIYR